MTDALRLARKAWSWLRRLGWRIWLGVLAGLTVGYAVGRGNAVVRQEKVEVIRWKGADRGAGKNLDAQRAALLAEKDSEIRVLRDRLANIDCDGTWTRETGAGGVVVERCVGRAVVVVTERADTADTRTTPRLPPPFAPPPLPVPEAVSLGRFAGLGAGYVDGLAFSGTLGMMLGERWMVQAVAGYPLHAIGMASRRF